MSLPKMGREWVFWGGNPPPKKGEKKLSIEVTFAWDITQSEWGELVVHQKTWENEGKEGKGEGKEGKGEGKAEGKDGKEGKYALN